MRRASDKNSGELDAGRAPSSLKRVAALSRGQARAKPRTHRTANKLEQNKKEESWERLASSGGIRTMRVWGSGTGVVLTFPLWDSS